MGGNEGDEGHGRHEGHEGHEGEDRERYDSCLLDQEQERQDREQEKVGVWQEERLDCCCHQGKEGIGSQGLCRNQEGLRSLQEGQGALPMNMHEHAKASAQGVGMSTPLERRCVGWTVSLVLSTIDE